MWKPEIISLEEYSKLIVKNKEEVNPKILKLCPECNSKDIYCLDVNINETFNCKNCNNRFFSPKIVRC